MKINVVTLFPQLVEPVTAFGVVGRAVRRGVLQVDYTDPRAFAEDPHRTVDDRPYGGGPGMVLKFEPVATALRSARRAVPDGAPTWCLSAQGRRFDQGMARKMAETPGFVLIAGRYEGIDQRLLDAEVDEELSIGDFVLSGGELAAMVVIDAVTRLLPGVLGDEESAQCDSFMNGLLDHPHYTRPECIAGRSVPPVLLQGNHQAIRRWRLKQSLGATWLNRPDLLDGVDLDEEQRRLLDEFIAEQR